MVKLARAPKALVKGATLRKKIVWPMRLVPHLCLKLIRELQGDLDDWDALSFRLALGVAMAQHFFTAATEPLHAATVANYQVYARVTHQGLWEVTEEESRLIGLGLWLVDDMEDQLSSAEQQFIFHQVTAGLRQYYQMTEVHNVHHPLS